MENRPQILQAVLYAHGGEMSKREITSLMNVSEDELAVIADELRQAIAGQGMELTETNASFSLRTAREYSEVVAQMQQQDNEKDIGAAGLEVLAIVLYKGEASRAAIDYIRGVNSSGTLRQLVLRGLLERKRNADDARAWLYSATPELLAHIGVSSSKELPEFEALTSMLNDTEKQHANNNDGQQ